jgi:hypothetical protein
MDTTIIVRGHVETQDEFCFRQDLEYTSPVSTGWLAKGLRHSSINWFKQHDGYVFDQLSFLISCDASSDLDVYVWHVVGALLIKMMVYLFGDVVIHRRKKPNTRPHWAVEVAEPVGLQCAQVQSQGKPMRGHWRSKCLHLV